MLKELFLSLPVVICALSVGSISSNSFYTIDNIERVTLFNRAPVKEDFGMIAYQDLNTHNTYSQQFTISETAVVNYRIAIPDFTLISGFDYSDMVGYVSGQSFNMFNYSIPIPQLDFADLDYGFGLNTETPQYQVDGQYYFAYCLMQADFYPNNDDYFNFWIVICPDNLDYWLFFCGSNADNSLTGFFSGHYFFYNNFRVCSTADYEYSYNDNYLFRVGKFGSTGALSTPDYREDENNLLLVFNLDIFSADSASDTSYSEGFDNGYRTGYNDGLNDFLRNGNPLVSLFFSIGDIPIRMMYSLFNFDVFGISMFLTLFGLVTLAVVIYIVRKVLLG